jgi:hypothetical protein
MTDKILQYVNMSTDAKACMSKNSLEIINRMSYENMGNELLSALHVITAKKEHKKSDFMAWTAINLWHGKYNTSGWDKLDKLWKEN